MMLRIPFILVMLVLLSRSIAAATEQGAKDVAVESPSGHSKLVLRVSNDGGLRYDVAYRGRRIVRPSGIDVRLANIGSLAAGATIEQVSRTEADETSKLPWGEVSHIRNHYRGAVVRLKSEHGIQWIIELRAFDGGVAMRYGIPEQDRVTKIAIEDENIEFRLDDDPRVLYMTCDNFTTSHEATYEYKPLSEVSSQKLIDKPLLAVWNDGAAAAITEARLLGFAGMYLERADSESKSLRTRLSPLPGKATTLVESKAPLWSPWRVVLLADEAGQLIESDVLLCLNDPPEGDFSWVKPGKTTFHWWNGNVENGRPSTPENNFAIHKKYIDFCAKHGIEYHSVISVQGNRPWFMQKDPGFAAPLPDTDILKARPDIDLPRILDYAKEKGVGIRFWVNWKPLSEHLEEAFALYEKWGIRGLMVDFMDRDDQEMIEWQEKCLQAAARHKLHIQFHGSQKPTGEERTYPNLFNREGVLNLEYSKWSDLVTPQHDVNVAYSRMLTGPVDYHLGGFRAAGREKFEPRDENPLLMGTRCHQLAMYVVYDNPMPMVADHPDAYEGQAGFDFIAEVPTTWDETRFVMGDVGEYIVVARRRGDGWYLGGITDWNVRKLAIPTEFLGEGDYDVTLYVDHTENEKNPNGLNVERRQMKAGESLNVTLESGGGVAAVFKPAR
jgi:alpha-glucosidase